MAERALDTDVTARRVRERAELAAAQGDSALALEVCRVLAELFREGYRLTELAPACVMEPRPVELRAKADGWCAECEQPFKQGDRVYWTRGHQGVECAACHAKPRAA